jgi:endogenous inhibitor of DNA gyrase (YacG/DUF329 family)
MRCYREVCKARLSYFSSAPRCQYVDLREGNRESKEVSDEQNKQHACPLNRRKHGFFHKREFAIFRRQSPQTACKAERLGIVTVVPLSVTKCLFLNSLNVRVIVSRVEPIHSAICS